MEGLKQITCKSCGQPLVRNGNNYTCNYCGNVWVADLADDIHAVQRANAWEALRLGDFEKATELFDEILLKNNNDHEAHWGKALSLNAILYVIDLSEHKRVPTCNNITESSFLNHKDVVKAISLAPSEISESYKKQAEYIEKVRVEWLEVARKEPEYDVFISFKDSDRENGIDRTQDSIDAQDIYTGLVEQGYKVFFSRVSLSGKVSEQYEPYIYNAIKTAKVMIVFGEKAEYFSSTWIKNEWSRFRTRIEKGEKHKNALVVVTKNMNASDLPSALKSRQALKMEDITFFETLKRHIKRIVDESKQGVRLDKIEIKGGQISKKATSLEVNTIQTREIGAGATAKTDITEKQTLKLVETYMKLGDWEDALKLTDEVLLNNSSCAEARWKQLLIKYKVMTNADLVLMLAWMNETELKAIDQILSQANEEMATEILDLLYSSYNSGVTDWQYCDILKIILPYQYKNREQKIKNAFDFAIRSSARKTFELLLSTIESDDVDFYIDLNFKYVKNAEYHGEKIECLNRILKVDEGNVDALSMLLYLKLEINEDSKTVIKTFETLLKYSSNGKSEISNILRWLALNINSADDCLLARQVLRYSSEDISVYKNELIDLSSSMINGSFFEDAEYFSKLILSFDAENATAYWNICLIKTHSSFENKIIESDILLGSIPEFNKYLTLVSEDRQTVCIKLKIEQEKTIKQREEARVAEIRRREREAEQKRKFLEEKERKERIEREVKRKQEKIMRSFRIRERIKKITAITGLCALIATAVVLFFSEFLPMIFLNSGKFGLYVRYKKSTEFVIPEGVTSIGAYEFGDCSSLTSVVIPASVKSIGDEAFSDCYRLVEVVNKSTNITVTKGSDSNGDVGYYALAVYNANDEYQTKLSNDNGYIIYTDANEKILVGYTGNKTKLILPSNITKINNYAFKECTRLTSVKIPDSVTSIGKDAFDGCDRLKEITLPFVGATLNGTSNTHFSYIFGSSSYSYNNYHVPKSLRKVTITGGFLIPSNAFNNCDSLTSVEIPDSVTSIGDNAFSGCGNLASVIIGNRVTIIGDYAFRDCMSLTSIKYRGTQAQWNAISKGNRWNYKTGYYTITYNYTGE